MHSFKTAAAECCTYSFDIGRGVKVAAAIGLVAVLASCSLQPEAKAGSPVVGANSLNNKVATVGRMQTTQTQLATAETDNVDVDLQQSASVVGYYGKGPYICSPSGFGHRSQCVPRM
ncbi:hypothetical protein JJB09_02930 [Rhizobium sp. KVB221]|uniref:Uncharacterized protein n=1 Tax=Rhizobium setariae TaxID=2801340 RepID=A0A937CNA9_9HYPH|nr:hypothetical protein [Rhizobium setariae]MBL0370973.1 hypothetical protein [Rhizobium setariae]